MKLLVFDNQFVMFCNKSSVLLVSEINVADASANLLFADRVGSAVVVDRHEVSLFELASFLVVGLHVLVANDV